MSADNWAVCPKCAANAEAERLALIDAAAAAYGNVPAEEYETLRAQAAVPVDPEASFLTFREDYEIYGATSGVVKVTYSGYCQTCRTSLKFDFERPIPGLEKE